MMEEMVINKIIAEEKNEIRLNSLYIERFKDREGETYSEIIKRLELENKIREKIINFLEETKNELHTESQENSL